MYNTTCIISTKLYRAMKNMKHKTNFGHFSDKGDESFRKKFE